MDKQSLVFKALSDPNRRSILDYLSENERSVSDITEHLDISQPAVSQHLSYLKEVDLLLDRKAGRQRFYKTNPEPLSEITDWLSKYDKFWDQKLASFESLLKKKVN